MEYQGPGVYGNPNQAHFVGYTSFLQNIANRMCFGMSVLFWKMILYEPYPCCVNYLVISFAVEKMSRMPVVDILMQLAEKGNEYKQTSKHNTTVAYIS